jgi:hypothetical protein
LYLYNCPHEDEHSCSKHVEDSNKHIIEGTVRQIGHLPELLLLPQDRKTITN